jgi:hypothetical protein
MFLSGTMAASVMGASYVWNGGVVANGADMGPGSALDGAARDAAMASLLGGLAALCGLAGAFVGAIVARDALAPRQAVPDTRGWMTEAVGSETLPPFERRDGSLETVWSDPAFDRRRSAVPDRRHRH